MTERLLFTGVAAGLASIAVFVVAGTAAYSQGTEAESPASTPYQIAAEAGEALSNANTGFNIWAGWEENHRPGFDELGANLRDQYGAQDVVFNVMGVDGEDATAEAFCVTASTSNSSAFYSSETGETVTDEPFHDYVCETQE